MESEHIHSEAYKNIFLWLAPRTLELFATARFTSGKVEKDTKEKKVKSWEKLLGREELIAIEHTKSVDVSDERSELWTDNISTETTEKPTRMRRTIDNENKNESADIEKTQQNAKDNEERGFTKKKQ